jgi:deoxycytidylate deaminase
VTLFDEMFNAACKSERVYRARMVACLTHRGKPVAYGRNQIKSHPFQKRFGKMEDCINLHAETDCIKNALKEYTIRDVERCFLYIMRVKKMEKGKDFVPGLACPCSGCMRAITTFGINKVFYSEDNKYEWCCL